MVHYRFIDHTADFGIEVTAANLNTLFADAALAMMELIVDGKDEPETESVSVHVAGDDWPDLMVNWLREALYLWNGEERLITSVAISEMADYRLDAVVGLRGFDPETDTIHNELKAVTYHQIEVAEDDEGWKARVIFDV